MPRDCAPDDLTEGAYGLLEDASGAFHLATLAADAIHDRGAEEAMPALIGVIRDKAMLVRDGLDRLSGGRVPRHMNEEADRRVEALVALTQATPMTMDWWAGATDGVPVLALEKMAAQAKAGS